MLNSLNPKRLLATNTLPLVFALFSYVRFYQLVKPILDESNIRSWYLFFVVFLAVSIVQLIYTIITIAKKRKVGSTFSLLAIIVYPGLLALYWEMADQIFPVNLPNYLVPNNLPFYLSIALMPTIIHCLFITVVRFTAQVDQSKPFKSLLAALVIPISWYIFFQNILPFWQPSENGFEQHLITVFFVASTVVFLFFIIKMAYIMSQKKGPLNRTALLTWRVIIGIILPIIGLAINNDNFFGAGLNLFGNFGNPWFYIIAIINGLVLFIDQVKNHKLNLLLFAVKSIGLIYVIYFFLIFLPYLPLSILITIIGVGFLMLTPIMLMIMQAANMVSHFRSLQNHFHKKQIIVVFLTSFLVIPLTITASYMRDRYVLNNALTYVFEDNSNQGPTVRNGSLKRTLKQISTHKERGDFFDNSKPILSPYYNWLVLDNMTLSSYKVKILKDVFFGTTISQESGTLGSPTNRNQQNVEIQSTQIESKYMSDGYWQSNIKLKIKNEGDMNSSEFVTTFDLPEGTWIKDYSLWIEDKKEEGILAEKKAATWLYQQIVRGPRDPGVLHYLTGNKVAFRVFPFKAKEVRTTSIELIHHEPVELNIDRFHIALGNTNSLGGVKQIVKSESALYISSKAKDNLSKVNRAPYFHFLVDNSVGSEAHLNDYLGQANSLMKTSEIGFENAMVSFVGAYVQTYTFDENLFSKVKSSGGFYLEKAFKKILTDNFQKQHNKFPVFVVLTDDIQSAVFIKDLADYKVSFPESDYFFSLDSFGTFKKHSFVTNPLIAIADSADIEDILNPVLKRTDTSGRSTFLRDNGRPSIIPSFTDSPENRINKHLDPWQAALNAQGLWYKYKFGTKDPQKQWLRLVNESFMSQTMNPTTAFLALENESQKELLRRKQQQVLSGKQSLDLGEDVHQMSEPSLLILMLLLGAILLVKKLW